MWNITENIDTYGCCTANDCIFRDECANHNSAGRFREQDGFRPEIFYDDETKEFFCKTSYENQHHSLEGYPENVNSLERGFVPIKV